MALVIDALITVHILHTMWGQSVFWKHGCRGRMTGQQQVSHLETSWEGWSGPRRLGEPHSGHPPAWTQHRSTPEPGQSPALTQL